MSTSPIDLSALPQPTPFNVTRSGVNFSRPAKDTWGTILIPIVQHRFPPNSTSLENCPQCGNAYTSAFRIKADILATENKNFKQELAIQRDRSELEKLQLRLKCDRLSAELKAKGVIGTNSSKTVRHLTTSPARVSSPSLRQITASFNSATMYLTNKFEDILHWARKLGRRPTIPNRRPTLVNHICE